MKTKITSSLLCLSLGLLPSIVEAEIPSLETQTTNQQLKHQVSGVIVDSSSKEPLIGVSILVKGTSSGTVTDIDGKFSLSVSASDILELSYVGYKTQTIKVGAKDYFEINLSADKKLLDEVVVVGYGSMKKSDLTGAVVSANLKDFKKTPHSNVIEVLQGTVPGLNVGQVTSAGSTPSFSIRGTNTLSGKTDVLIVLDGIIYSNSLSSINPNDIESIDVLKDASATAVYGAQAANGVLLITTKRGKKGKTKIDFSTSLSLSSPTKDIRPMNRSEYLEFTRNLWYEEAFQGPDYKTPNPDFRLASKLPDTVMMDPESPDGIVPYDYDWWDEGTQSGSIWENKLSMSGGSDGINYLISYSNTNQQGYILNDNFKRNTVRVNLDIQDRKSVV